MHDISARFDGISFGGSNKGIKSHTPTSDAIYEVAEVGIYGSFEQTKELNVNSFYDYLFYKRRNEYNDYMNAKEN